MKTYSYIVVGETVQQAEYWIKYFDRYFHDKCKAMSIRTMKRTEPVPARGLTIAGWYVSNISSEDLEFAQQYYKQYLRLANGLSEED